MQNFIRTKIFRIEVVFFLIALVGFFLIYPPTFNFGDHASWGLIFQKNLVNYVSHYNSIAGSFSDYFREVYKSFHLDKLPRPDALETYGLDSKAEVAWILNPNYYSVYILSRLTTLVIYFLSLGMLNVEASEFVFSIIAFFFTFIYAYKFGKLLFDKQFGLVLGVIALSNVYFNQLVRSTMNPFAVIYPALFFASIYYLFLLHKKDIKKKLPLIIVFSFILALNFLNGYPNTNFLLLGLIFVIFILLAINILFFHNRQYSLLNWRNYPVIILISLFFIFLISGIWSYLLGEHIFFGVNAILHDRIWGQILGGRFLTNEIYKFNIWQFPSIFINTLRVLFIGSEVHAGPHEPSFLHDISFFNIIESFFFLWGIVYILKNFINKKIENQLMFVILLFFLQRLTSNSANYLIVGRYTYDFYFVTVIISALGFWTFFRTKIFRNSVYSSGILLFVLFISLLLNISVFNNKFIWEYDEGDKQMYGLNELRELYRNEISKNNNLLIYDYNRANGYEYYIDLITLLENKTDYEVFDVFFNDVNVNSLATFNDYLKNSNYKNIYIILPVGLSKMGASVMFEPLYNFTFSTRKFSKYFGFYKPYKTIKNRRGIPTFWIYKFNKINQYYTLDISGQQDTYKINFEDEKKIDYIDLPGSIEKIDLIFDDKNTLTLDFEKFSFDRFHFSFDENSIIDIYNNFNFGEEKSNIEKSEAKITSGNDTDGMLVNFLDPQKLPAEVLFKYQIGYPIKKAYLNVPFIFYNDQFLINEFSLFYRTKNDQNWSRTFIKKSNGNIRYSDYDDYRIFETQPSFSPNRHFSALSVLSLNDEKSLYLKYKIASIYPQSVRPYSSFSLPESSRNFVKFEVDTSRYKNYKQIPINKLILKIKFKEFSKESLYNTISLGMHK